MDKRHLLGVVSQIECLLHRRVAAADHRDVLAAIKEPVAGGAGGDAPALQSLFRLQAEPSTPSAEHVTPNQSAFARDSARATGTMPWP